MGAELRLPDFLAPYPGPAEPSMDNQFVFFCQGFSCYFKRTSTLKEKLL